MNVSQEIECQQRASHFLSRILGTDTEDLRWDGEHHLQGHVHVDGHELVVIAPRDDHHNTVVMTAEDWDVFHRAMTDHRRELLEAIAIRDHDQLITALATAPSFSVSGR